MKTIYKYPIPQFPGQVIVPLPIGAEVLSVGQQNDQLMLWAKVESDEPAVSRRAFYLAVTGEDTLPESGKFLGTVLLFDGGTVVHIFDLGLKS